MCAHDESRNNGWSIKIVGFERSKELTLFVGEFVVYQSETLSVDETKSIHGIVADKERILEL